MSTVQQKCILQSEDGVNPNIEISGNDFITIGRSPQFGLRDELVSRNQIRAKVDFTQKRLVFEVLGPNPASLNYTQLEREREYRAKHGDIIEMVSNKHPYKVLFEHVDESMMDENGNGNTNESENSTSTGNLNGSKNSKKVVQKISESIGSGSSKKKRQSRIEDSSDEDGDDDDEDNVPLKRPKTRIDLKRDKAPFTDITTWQSYNKGELFVYTPDDCEGAAKIAAYDMDGTLITTKTGKVFPEGVDDWKLAFGNVKSTLTKQQAASYKIVIFTNQAGLSSGKVDLSDMRTKIEKLVKHINLPVQVFIAAGDSLFRKPCTMMWHALSDHLNDDVLIDKKKSFYVGDAAGRPLNKALKKKKDHSCVDRLFAMNLDLEFLTPEEHFSKHKKSEWEKPDFDPRTALANVPKSLLEPKSAHLISDSVEVIIMVGGPGSGKSTFCRNYLASAGYVVINRDELISWQKCQKRCDECLIDGKKVVIDNTNTKPEERARYIKMALKRKVKCRCFVMATTFSQAKHNVHFRELLNPSHAKINKVTLNTYNKYYKEPTLKEGFAEIVTVNFIPKFRNEEEKKLYGMYLLG